MSVVNCVYHSEGSSAESITFSYAVFDGKSYGLSDRNAIPTISIKTDAGNPVVSSSPSEITELTDTITVTFVAGTTESICSTFFIPIQGLRLILVYLPHITMLLQQH